MPELISTIKKHVCFFDLSAAEWNFSTSFERREKDRRLDSLTDKAQQWTHQITETLPSKKQYDSTCP